MTWFIAPRGEKNGATDDTARRLRFVSSASTREAAERYVRDRLDPSDWIIFEAPDALAAFAHLRELDQGKR